MPYQDWHLEINQFIKKNLDQTLTADKFSQVIDYSVFPAGKLFRPILGYSLATDLGKVTESHLSLFSAIELHHSYTLVHDDLPAMDDDDYRRGKLSCHKKFSEYEAILAGDGLLNLSYEFLMKIESDKIREITTLFAQSLGQDGLILGQVLDLRLENKTIDQILRIHELKTARLIQTTLRITNIISESILKDKECLDLGLAIGLNFQLLDDLCELTEDISSHEEDINPFLHFDQEKLLNIIAENNKMINDICNTHNLSKTKGYIDLYLDKIQNLLLNGREELSKSLDVDVDKLLKKIGTHS